MKVIISQNYVVFSFLFFLITASITQFAMEMLWLFEWFFSLSPYFTFLALSPIFDIVLFPFVSELFYFCFWVLSYLFWVHRLYSPHLVNFDLFFCLFWFHIIDFFRKVLKLWSFCDGRYIILKKYIFEACFSTQTSWFWQKTSRICNALRLLLAKANEPYHNLLLQQHWIQN